MKESIKSCWAYICGSCTGCLVGYSLGWFLDQLPSITAMCFTLFFMSCLVLVGGLVYITKQLEIDTLELKHSIKCGKCHNSPIKEWMNIQKMRYMRTGDEL
jgi:hypothetical protein